MDIIKDGFGTNLRNLRKLKNFTQEKLAEVVGINLRQLARIEAGKSFISSETLFKICTALDIAPSTLFDIDIDEAYLMTGTDAKMHFSVIKSGNIIQLVKEKYVNFEEPACNLPQIAEFDEKMINLAKKLHKEITVDEIQDGSIAYTKIYKPSGEIETSNLKSTNKDAETLKNKINSIINDRRKIEFMNLAFDSLSSKDALNQLKILIKGIELIQ